MSRTQPFFTSAIAVVVSCLFAAPALCAQQSASSSAATVTSVPRVMRVTGTFVPATGLPPAPVETITLAIYAEATGGAPLWQETQTVAVDAEGRYSLLLGATQPEGLPLELFASGEARWLGRRFERPGEGEQARVLLASVPYALKASDADTLGGRPPSRICWRSRARVTGRSRDEAECGRDEHRRLGHVHDRVPPLPLSAGTANFVGKFVNADRPGGFGDL